MNLIIEKLNDKYLGASIQEASRSGAEDEIQKINLYSLLGISVAWSVLAVGLGFELCYNPHLQKASVILFFILIFAAGVPMFYYSILDLLRMKVNSIP